MHQVTTEKLMDDLRTVVSDAEELLRATAGQAGEQIRTARARAEESLRSARERLKTFEGEVLSQVHDQAKVADRYVHDHPWGAVGVAAGIGFLVGVLVSRR